ncbi:MAG: hypothetical protein ACM3SY_03545 [Candidatus Omnitrophota bacterium]
MKKRVPVILQLVSVSVVMYVYDWLFIPQRSGSMLVGFLFWVAVGQGVLALLAAVDLSGGKWIKSIRPYIQRYYPLLALFPIAFLIFTRHMAVYPWTAAPARWFNQPAFIIRNEIFLLLPLIFAHFYVRAARKESRALGVYAVLYLLAFVVGQSFIAFDMVMSLDYPWVNTLFGGFFFIESFYTGIAFALILTGLLARKDLERFKLAFSDLTVLFMGFALFWAGLFYAQYLVIWYGNLPEEVRYIERRQSTSQLMAMGIYVLATLFFIPFFSLLSRKVKAAVPAVFAIALLFFSGLIVERLIYLIPDTPIRTVHVIVYWVLFGLPYLYLLMEQYRSTHIRRHSEKVDNA